MDIVVITIDFAIDVEIDIVVVIGIPMGNTFRLKKVQGWHFKGHRGHFYILPS